MKADTNRSLQRNRMNIIIKRMETDEEIRGKAFVHWKAWHEAYPGLISQEYLDNLTYKNVKASLSIGRII